jgi:hypothetical protein
MKRYLMIALMLLPLVTALSGCVVYDERGHYGRPHFHDWR